MSKLPRITPQELEARLLGAGFEWVRTRGSHRIYERGSARVVVPFHAGRVLHPKIVKNALDAIERGKT